MSSPSRSDNVSLLVALLLDFISVWDKKPDKGRAKKSKQHQKDIRPTSVRSREMTSTCCNLKTVRTCRRLSSWFPSCTVSRSGIAGPPTAAADGGESKRRVGCGTSSERRPQRDSAFSVRRFISLQRRFYWRRRRSPSTRNLSPEPVNYDSNIS